MPIKRGKSAGLAKLISYILGRKPVEFGLVADPDGFVKIKELLKAINEEDGFKYVRRSHIDEIRITLPNPPFEIRENLIRATDRSHLSGYAIPDVLPKLLYVCVRERAYPVVLKNGIVAINGPHVILSSDRDMALRLGRRFDRTPTVLTVNTLQAQQKGVHFYAAGEMLYMSDAIPCGCFSGPPLPKQLTDIGPKVDKPHVPAGSFFIDFSDKADPQKPYDRKKQLDKISKEKAIKQSRRQKQKILGR